MVFRALTSDRVAYHVSSLIQVSKIAQQDQNSALSADLCERALFTLGKVTLSSFRKKLQEGKARMNFLYPENRQFWLAGYSYIRTLISKGTYRTALEWTKLLMSISPSDEYGLINFVHALAIRAHEAQWFIDLCDDLSFNSSQWKGPMHEYVRQTVVLAKLQVKDISGARKALEDGISKLPWIYSSVFTILNLDAPRSIWGIVPRNGTEDLYTALYLQVTKDLWNNAPAISLLKEVANNVPRPDISSLPAPDKVTLNIARFAYLGNSPPMMALVPPPLLHTAPNFDFDPLPPPEETNVFSSPIQRLPWEVTRARARASAAAAAAAAATAAEAAEAAEVEPRAGDESIQEGNDESIQEGSDESVQESSDESVQEGRGLLRRILEMVWPGGGQSVEQRMVLGEWPAAAPDEDDEDDEEDEDDVDEEDEGDDFGDHGDLDYNDPVISPGQARTHDVEDDDDDLPPLEPMED